MFDFALCSASPAGSVVALLQLVCCSKARLPGMIDAVASSCSQGRIPDTQMQFVAGRSLADEQTALTDYRHYLCVRCRVQSCSCSTFALVVCRQCHFSVEPAAYQHMGSKKRRVIVGFRDVYCVCLLPAASVVDVVGTV
jgi:hypothetical protein